MAENSPIASEQEIKKLEEAVEAQGRIVRELKASSPQEKGKIGSAVKELLSLKEKLRIAKGEPKNESNKKKKKKKKKAAGDNAGGEDVRAAAKRDRALAREEEEAKKRAEILAKVPRQMLKELVEGNEKYGIYHHIRR